MSKVIDITDKLSFEENPKIKIGKKELEVDATATTMLKVMQLLGDGTNTGPNDVVAMYNLIFSEKDRKEIDKMKLSFGDFQQVVMSAINLVIGEEESGEQ